MSRYILAVLCLAAWGFDLAAETHVAFRPGGEPVELQRQKSAAPSPTFALMLPAFFVDPEGFSGVSTLYSIRNRSEEPVAVRVSYFDVRGAGVRTDELTLAANELVPVNIRDVGGLPINPSSGLIEGTVLFSTIDPDTGDVVVSDVLGGDFFIVDPGEDFASGNVLFDAVEDLCSSWDLRFFNGGAFDGGTELLFVAPFNGDGDEPSLVAEGNVYDEGGTFLGTATVTSADALVSLNTRQDFEPHLPVDFGVIEWGFADGEVGVLLGTFDALGRFSVGVPAVCTDR